jgi:hypothetical protein
VILLSLRDVRAEWSEVHLLVTHEMTIDGVAFVMSDASSPSGRSEAACELHADLSTALLLDTTLDGSGVSGVIDSMVTEFTAIPDEVATSGAPQFAFVVRVRYYRALSEAV